MGDLFVVGVVAVGVVLVGVIEVLVLVVVVTGGVVMVGIGGVLDDLLAGGSRGILGGLPPSLFVLAGLEVGVWSDRESRDFP